MVSSGGLLDLVHSFRDLAAVVAGGRHVDDITLEGIDDRFVSLLGQARAALEAAPDKTPKVSWWLE